MRVELLSGRDLEFDPPPGRVYLVRSSHTFGDLAAAIEATFARWDQSHLHEFRLADGVRIGLADADLDDDDVLDEDDVALAVLGGPGVEFEYEFDFGDGWTHRCTVEEFDDVDLGGALSQPIPVWGWGTLPDQYGRETADLDDEG